MTRSFAGPDTQRPISKRTPSVTATGTRQPKDSVMNDTILHLIDCYVNYLRLSGYRHRVIANNRRQLDEFALWAESLNVIDTHGVTLRIIRGYHAHLGNATNAQGQCLNLMIQRERLTKLRRFLSWLHREGIINIDLSAGVPTATRRGKLA
jgi:site-specific recombinase XerC